MSIDIDHLLIRWNDGTFDDQSFIYASIFDPLSFDLSSVFFTSSIFICSRFNVRGDFGGTDHLNDGLSDNVVKDVNYQYYFENTPANYLVDFDTLNQRKVWVFPKTENTFTTYFLIREAGDIAILCSTEIKEACNCRWDLYAYQKFEDEMVWLKSQNLFSVRNELRALVRSEFQKIPNDIEALKFCELIQSIQE